VRKLGNQTTTTTLMTLPFASPIPLPSIDAQVAAPFPVRPSLLLLLLGRGEVDLSPCSAIVGCGECAGEYQGKQNTISHGVTHP
jgi:hypothetical protein